MSHDTSKYHYVNFYIPYMSNPKGNLSKESNGDIWFLNPSIRLTILIMREHPRCQCQVYLTNADHPLKWPP